MNHPTLLHRDHPTLTQGELDNLEKTYQSQLVSLILGRSDPTKAKHTLDSLSAHLRAGNRDPVRLVDGATKMAQGIRGLER